MSNINQAIRAKAEPGVLEVIEWALIVHQNTMVVTTRRDVDGNELAPAVIEQLTRMFTLDEREEARKTLLEYGAGKPTRIVEHRGSKTHPLTFRAVTNTPQLPVADSEVLITNNHDTA